MTIRMSQDELSIYAYSTPYAPQRVKLQEAMNEGWKVYQVQAKRGGWLVSVKRGEMFAIIWPNGRFQRPAIGKRSIPFSWEDVIASAELVRIREKEAVSS